MTEILHYSIFVLFSFLLVVLQMQVFQQGIEVIAEAGMYKMDRTVQDIGQLLGDLLQWQQNIMRRGLTLRMLIYYKS